MGQEEFFPEEKRYLLRLAREAAAAALTGGRRKPTPAELEKFPRLKEPGACFTTFKLPQPGAKGGGELRGCLGVLEARRPLAEEIARTAADTVLYDLRFSGNRITPAELPKLKIDLSVLHPSRTLKEPTAFELGKDGITVIGKGKFAGRRGVYLPQVATEYGMSKEEFLNSCCGHKAEMAADAWKSPELCEVRAFRAEVFSDDDFPA